ncbi:MAG: beta-hydroxyacyl-ACP dehydratase [Prevotellaceae bacterium]|jgi:3-hydroxyacyl-[acyl-carrier-protein] dehydratase|nr:beta-hydroxyacyl-ACP dehydratase [Prevotellaceae bacterium]
MKNNIVLARAPMDSGKALFVMEEFSKDGHSFRATVRLNEKHPVFEGHFPGQPVVPGVFTLQLVKECLSYALEKELRFTDVQNCRFSRTIVPGAQPRLEVRGSCEQQAAEAYALNASVQAAGVTFLSLKAKLVAAAPRMF